MADVDRCSVLLRVQVLVKFEDPAPHLAFLRSVLSITKRFTWYGTELKQEHIIWFHSFTLQVT